MRLSIPSVGNDVDKLELVYTPGGNVKYGTTTLKMFGCFFEKLKHIIPT